MADVSGLITTNSTPCAPTAISVNELSADDLRALAGWVDVLENPGLAASLVSLIGRPIEMGMSYLPDGTASMINNATAAAMKAALKVAVSTLGKAPSSFSGLLHKTLATATGVAGGMVGMAGLVVELPITTTIMLRSIADIAKNSGEDLSFPENQLECLTVFALGTRSEADDGAEAGYYAARVGLAVLVRQAASYLAVNGMATESAPVIAKLMTVLASRFSGPVAQKLVAQSLPLVGAVGGGAVNLIFTSHYQGVAEAHFGVRALERKYGEQCVGDAYKRLAITIVPPKTIAVEAKQPPQVLEHRPTDS